MLRYLELPRACDTAFVTFLVSWFLTRHVGFLLVLYSLWFRYPILRPRWVIWNTDELYTIKTYYSFAALLGTLQVIMWMWFITIINVAWSVIQGKPAEDTRSDEEYDISFISFAGN